MAVLKTEFHLWTLKSQLLIPETGLGFQSYHEKNQKGNSACNYYEEKQVFLQTHGKIWTPSNKRPDKLRDSLKEMEEVLSSANNLFCWWKTENTLLVLLPSGLVYWVSIDHDQGDITKITKDSSLVGKISLANICDVVFSPTFIAMCSSDSPKLEVIYFIKGTLSDISHKKISTLELKIQLVDLPGRIGRTLQRKIQVSPLADAVLVYWPVASEEAWPWAPMSSEEERANLCVVSLVNYKPSMIAYTNTESDPLDVQFSVSDSNKILSVEKSLNVKNPRADICTYEITKSFVHLTHRYVVPLNSSLTRARWDNSQKYLIMTCEDNSLVLYTDIVKTTLSRKADIQADIILWNFNGAIIFIVSKKGDLQIFDKGLTQVDLTMEGAEYVPVIKLSNFFRLSPNVKQVVWCCHSTHVSGQGRSTRNSLLVAFDRGPIGLLKFLGSNMGNSDLSNLTLTAEYIKCKSFSQAAQLLRVMSWETEGIDCFMCLSNIVNALLREPLNKHNEDLLEATLGCFYAPQKALAEVVILEYRMHISYLARRFFHHLVRYSRFDKAFLLAVDINARDLFMDLYYAALDAGQTRLAAAAKHKATLCEEDLIFSDSCSSVNGDVVTDDEFYSGASSNGSIVDSQEKAELIVQALVNGSAPPLPPKQSLNSPPVPSRAVRANSLTPAGSSTPPLPPRTRIHHAKKQQINAQSPAEQPAVASNGSSGTGTSKYHRVSGCTLPGGYSYDIGPDIAHRIIEEFSSVMVDESLDYSPMRDMDSEEQKKSRPIKVLNLGLV